MKMLEKEVCAEIKDAERTVSLSQEKCTAITQRIPEIMELEKTEKDQVTDIVLILLFKKESCQYTITIYQSSYTYNVLTTFFFT